MRPNGTLCVRPQTIVTKILAHPEHSAHSYKYGTAVSSILLKMYKVHPLITLKKLTTIHSEHTSVYNGRQFSGRYKLKIIKLID